MKAFCKCLPVLLIIAAALCACNKNKEDKKKNESIAQIEALVKEVKLPVQIDSTTTITDIKYEDGVLTSRIEIPASRLSRVKLDSLAKSQIIRMNTELGSRKLRKLAIDGDVTLRYIYYNGNEELKLEITPEQLKESE